MPKTEYGLRKVNFTEKQKNELSKAIALKSPIVLRLSKKQISEEGEHGIPFTQQQLNKMTKNLAKRNSGSEVKLSKTLLRHYNKEVKGGALSIDAIYPTSHTKYLKAVRVGEEVVSGKLVMGDKSAAGDGNVDSNACGEEPHGTERGKVSISAVANTNTPPQEAPHPSQKTCGINKPRGKVVVRGVPTPKPTRGGYPQTSGE